MIKISVTKIDDKGRINLPAHFLKANNIQRGSEVIIEGVINNSDSVKLKFKGVKDAK
jgi:bifunctional DNA-binding transcriptional regulator/antitoxin component of YhaV-PrlF toxin-antitoxin module